MTVGLRFNCKIRPESDSVYDLTAIDSRAATVAVHGTQLHRRDAAVLSLPVCRYGELYFRFFLHFASQTLQLTPSTGPQVFAGLT